MDALPIARKARPLGRSSLAAFPIAVGCWRLVGDDVRAARAKREGTQRVARLADCLRAFEVRLTRRDWYAIVAASRGEALP